MITRRTRPLLALLPLALLAPGCSTAPAPSSPAAAAPHAADLDSARRVSLSSGDGLGDTLFRDATPARDLDGAAPRFAEVPSR